MTTGKRTALIAGATGLVGSELLKLLIASDAYHKVLVLTRRELGLRTRHPKLRQVLVDFGRLEQHREDLRADHVYCTLGTTIAKAGSQAEFVKVDLDYPLRLARVTLAEGARHFSIVTALGSSRSSPFFYSRVKGEVEAELEAMDWPSLAVVRPSVIAGERAERRPAEKLSQALLRYAPALWRSVPAADIAACMVDVALREPEGVLEVDSKDIPRA
ncbi:MAG: NAD(P)H-binding protein [Steroidobacteraceae bacterium]